MKVKRVTPSLATTVRAPEEISCQLKCCLPETRFASRRGSIAADIEMSVNSSSSRKPKRDGCRGGGSADMNDSRGRQIRPSGIGRYLLSLHQTASFGNIGLARRAASANAGFGTSGRPLDDKLGPSGGARWTRQ